MGACISILENANKAEQLSNRVMDLEKENANLQAALQQQQGGGHAAPWQGHHQPAAAPSSYPAAGGAGVVDVLFFPDRGMPCRNFLQGRHCNRPNCTYVHENTSLTKLLSYINSATRSLDICVFTITCNEIADAITAAAQRGVAVRVISDNDQAASQGSDVSSLRQAGIPVRLDKDANHMHHKFAIIDGRLLINGSFNWTRNAVLGNQENVTILDNPAAIQRFGQQFEHMWRLFA